MKAATTRKSYTTIGAPPRCPHCRRALPASSPRVQVGGRWYCPDGAYLAWHPGAATIARPRPPKEPQSETLSFEDPA